MIILGVDPGTLIAGYGVIERNGKTISLLDVGVIKNTADVSMPLRLKKIYSTLCSVIDRFHPDEFAIETAFYSKNAQSALKIGQARGVSILASVNHEIPVTEYSPREVKKAVTGKGAASKEQVQYMMMSMLKLKTTPKHFDSTDALAIAVCHAFKISTPRSGFPQKKRRVDKNWKSFIEANPNRVLRIK
ncbi:MAG: crossover junction endodeoxyribonuclease RuvC [Bacteroidota bacterium]|nr:crossover junction endodeoxyribonuclease RuvC [Bacteroidota bacterium]